jgi:hypothetical protein
VDFDTIKQQFLQDQLKYHLSEKPYFFTCMINDQIQVIGIDEVKRDEPDLLAIRLLFPDPLLGHLHQGQQFAVMEGLKVVGHGKILQVRNPLLLQR